VKVACLGRDEITHSRSLSMDFGIRIWIGQVRRVGKLERKYRVGSGVDE
jgi:hypothetical protein